MKKNVVVTGGAGFVGSNLVRELINQKYNVFILSRKNSSYWRVQDMLNKIEKFEGLLEKKKRLQSVMKKINPQYIFHLATYGSYPKQKNVRRMIDVNIKYTYNLLEATYKLPYYKFIITGSSSEYGKKDKPMSEDNMLEPNNYYGANKAASSLMSQVYAMTTNKPVTIARLFSVYGPNEEKGRLVRTVIEKMLKNEDMRLATGKEARDFIYIKDVVNGLISLAKSPTPNGEIVNLGTGKQSTILELAKEVKKITKSESKILLNAYPGRPWDTTTWVANTQKMKRNLNWQPAFDLNRGLKETISWYAKNQN